MSRAGLTRLLFVGVACAVVALAVSSVRSTGALWSDQKANTPGGVTTGTLALQPGSGTGSTYQFPGLSGSNALPGDQSQAPLVITNTGSTPLRYRLSTAGPQVSTTGATVTLTLSGTVVSAGTTTCPTGTLPGTTAFTTLTTSSATTGATSAWRALAKGAGETWCIRSALQSSSPTTASVGYTVLFTFGAEQTRP